MKGFWLRISQLCLAAWVGAAILFVATAIQEVTSPELTSDDKRHLALLRFPLYYAFGFVLVSLSLLAALLSRGAALMGSGRYVTYVVLTALALTVYAVDYTAIYSPLVAMSTAQDEAYPADFAAYHRASKYINALHLGLCVAALAVAEARGIHFPPRAPRAASDRRGADSSDGNKASNEGTVG